ncbi:DUF3419 family protein [uncultured Cohaesibacter sp.]|uniref:DUF3419 family protein n=1 Tax=uncultured Cohaesibacter sp. TaxID=1002546 RepID=UPI0029C637B0|nr:DUF3419 family protein [uncultured Cohaesibacter sp.]
MDQSLSVKERIALVVNPDAAHSQEGILEHVFGRFFRGLVYAQIWEDPVADMTALALTQEDHLVCIASGGCNVMSYLCAQPASIDAVDLSPAHVALNRLKLTAAAHLPDQASFYDFFGHADRAGNIVNFDRYIAPELDVQSLKYWDGMRLVGKRKHMFAKGFYRHGLLGRFIGLVHLVARIGRVRFQKLLAAETMAEQQRFFEEQIAPLFEAKLVRFLARRRSMLFGLGIPPAQYEKLAADLDGDIVAVLKERTRKLFCDFPIQNNYFAWQAANRGYAPDGNGPVPPYLEADNFERLRAGVDRVRILNQSITEMLATQSNASKSVFVLLDAQDWMNDRQLNELWTEITRTAKPGARVLFRTGGVDDILPGRVSSHLLDHWHYDADASQLATGQDRSAIYGGVHLYRLKG